MNFLSDIENMADEFEANMADLSADNALNPSEAEGADDGEVDSFLTFLALTDERVPA